MNTDLEHFYTVTIKGIVQGVGFRPFVYREALHYGIRGFVCNTPEGVEIHAHGKQFQPFMDALKTNHPRHARIDSIDMIRTEPAVYEGFEIRASRMGNQSAAIPNDTALCSQCEAEMYDPANRRHRYPFINCSECGPRYTIMNALPYDRERTSMKDFRMCFECICEYNDPFSRRYHAEPISCPNCGPKLRFLDNRGFAMDGDPIDIAAKMLKAGKIIALKGVGGFHLMCDATNDKGVSQIRKLKQRKSKPLAVMFGSLEQMGSYVFLDEFEKKHITDSIKPIVIVQAQPHSDLSSYVAPSIDRLGVLLPYTPLHRLLFDSIDVPLVATSANITEEPIMTCSSEVIDRFGDRIDGILDHDRTIVNALDDGVIQIAAERSVVLRLGRGLAPYTFSMGRPANKRAIALGGHQKSAIAISTEENMILSGHIGDLGNVEADRYFDRTVQTFKRFYDAGTSILVHDLHPKYASHLYAMKQEQEHYGIQHHYAHILACMAEYHLNESVIGIAYDGAGYGDDGSIWGGEVMLADTHTYKRIGNLKPIALLGGDKASKEPRRIALSLLFECFSLDEVLKLNSPTVQAFQANEIKTLHQMWAKNINAPRSSSMGRIFDAVASLGGFVQSLDYEGQGGMIIESYVGNSITEPFSFEVKDGIIDLSPMVREILSLDCDKKQIASRFIATVVMILDFYVSQYPQLPIVVGGGVFQNRVLMERLYARYSNRRFYAQQHTPINDGSIALGQLYYAYHNPQYHDNSDIFMNLQ